MEYCCHIWAGASACHLSMVDRVQKRVINLAGEELGSSLQPLSHHRYVANLCLFYRYFHGKCATSVSDLVPPVRVFKCETRLSACSHPYTLALPRYRTKSYSNSFFPRTASLWNSLPGACFPPSYNLDCFNPFASGIKKVLLYPITGLFSVKIQKKFLAIKNFSVNDTMSGQPNKRLI